MPEPPVREDIARWRAAGLIDAATAERILAFERERAARQSRADRPGLVEILIYVAAAIVAAGATLLAATNWDALAVAARIAVPGIAALVTLAAGYALRQTGAAPMLRAASLAWVLAGALAAATAAVAASEAGWSEDTVAIAAGLTAVAVALALWSQLRMHPQVIGIGAAWVLLSTSVSSLAADDWIIAALGAMLALFGLAALLATELGVFVPRASARIVAGAALAAGGVFAGMPPSPPLTELFAVPVIAILIGAALRQQSLVYVAFAVLTAFAALLRLILRHVDDPTLAALALIAIGLLLLAGIAAVARARTWERWRASPTPTAPAPDVAPP